MKQLSIVGTKARWTLLFGFLTGLVLLSSAAFGQDRLPPESRAKMIEMGQQMALAKPFLDRAEQYYYAGRLYDASEQCQRAVLMYQNINPLSASTALIMQAEIYIALDRVTEAIEVLEQVRALRGPGQRSSRLLVSLVVAYIRSNNASLAQQRLDELLLDQVTGYLRRDAAWTELMRLRNGGLAAWEALALSIRGMELSGQNKKVIYYLSHAVELAPDNPGISLLYGDSLRVERRWQEAKSQLRLAALATGRCGDWARNLLRWGALPPRGGG